MGRYDKLVLGLRMVWWVGMFFDKMKEVCFFVEVCNYVNNLSF